MAINFPNSPSVDDTYTENDKTWIFNGSAWVTQPVVIGGATQLTELSDVTTAAVDDKFALMADGAAYVGRALVEADISDLQTYSTASSTATFTNKTFDANGTGNSITNIDLTADVIGDLPYANIVPATAASKLVGRGSTGAGDMEEITIGSGLTMTGTTISATGGGGGGGGGGMTWQFNTSTSAGAATGEFRWNQTADPTAISSIYLSKASTQSGTYNVGGFTQKIRKGDTISVVAPDSSFHTSFLVTGPVVDNSTYYTIPTSTSSTDYGFPANLEDCSILYSATAGSESDPEYDAKGDIIAGTGNNAANRVAIGADGTVLTADSNATEGVAWTTVGGGGTTQGSSSTYDISAVARSSTPNARGEYSVDLQMQGNANDVASGVGSALIGGSFNMAAAQNSFIAGGTGNEVVAGGTASVILASQDSRVSYNNSAIIAHTDTAGNTTLAAYNSAIVGGSANALQGQMGGGYSAVIGGQTNSCFYQERSVILGGTGNQFTSFAGDNSVIGGTRVKVDGKSGVFAWGDSTNADFTITQSDSANFRVANGMHITAPLFIDERASALADIAGRGQIWVKTATPNELWFTDDAGSDRPISEAVYTVATLPTGVAGRRAFVTDSANTLASHHGQIVNSGGTDFVPVYHDGSSWHVG